jgi:hypothetical protein
MDGAYFDQINYLTICLLERIGMLSPTQEVIDIMESALVHVAVKHPLFLNKILKNHCDA